METQDDAGLLYGHPAIAAFLSLTERQVKHLSAKGSIPTFKMGKRVCARRSTLTAWLEQQEAAAGQRHAND